MLVLVDPPCCTSREVGRDGFLPGVVIPGTALITQDVAAHLLKSTQPGPRRGLADHHKLVW